MAKRRKQKRGISSRAQASPQSRAGLFIGAAAVGLLVLAVGYFHIFANTQVPASAAQVAQLTEETADASAVPDIPVAPRVGALAPDFTLADTTGNQVSLADFRGKPAVVTFFHTW